jgi:hypothetical protein
MFLFLHFWFQTELLPHQNIMMMTNISEKVMETKTSKFENMNQVIILFVKQRLLYQKEDLVEFLEEKKSMT